MLSLTHELLHMHSISPERGNKKCTLICFSLSSDTEIMRLQSCSPLDETGGRVHLQHKLLT